MLGRTALADRRDRRDVYVTKGYGGGPIEYQWREVGVEGVYTTDTNCQQI